MYNKHDNQHHNWQSSLTLNLIEQLADVVVTILKIVFLPDYNTKTKDEPRQDMGYSYPVDGEHQEPF